MKELKDTNQVGLANGSALGLSIADFNQYLTFISLTLAIAYTIYKFYHFETKK